MLRTTNPTLANDSNGTLLPTTTSTYTTSKNASFFSRTFQLRNILFALLTISVIYSVYFFASKRVKFSVIEKCETEKTKIIQDFASQIQHLETQISNIENVCISEY